MSILGSTHSDPVMTAMNALIQDGMRRMLELALTGFATSHAYDVEFFRKAAAGKQAVRIVSDGTQTDYLVALLPDTLTEHSVRCVHVGSFGELLNEANYRKLTLVRADNGTIWVEPGWRI